MYLKQFIIQIKQVIAQLIYFKVQKQQDILNKLYGISYQKQTYQFINMQSQFDWYKLSLINEQKPDIQKFQQIIRNGDILKGIQRVPTSYRKKLLIIFQQLSYKMKQQSRSMKNINQTLQYKKNAIASRIQQMQKGLQQSKQQLIRMKSGVGQKKKMIKKLNQKIQTIKKNKTQQTYFCPFCSRTDFNSRQIFTFHIYTQHQTYKSQQDNIKIGNNNSMTTSVNNELKDFIMTLKDKQMEMMKMILSQKKQMQTQELQKLYQKQMNIMTMKNKSQPQYLYTNKYALSQQLNYPYEQNINENGQQIHGQSQFLFYQKSQKYKQAAQKQQYSLKRTMQQRRKQLNKHPYYDIFKDMEENKSLNVDHERLEQQQTNRKYEVSNHGNDSYRNQQFNSDNKFLSKFNLKSNNQIISQPKSPVQPLKMTSTNLKFQQYNPSITDRLKQQQRKNSHHNTIYSTQNKISQNNGSTYNKTSSKGFIQQHQYVFNSGPILDDNGGYSDYEDYFGQDANKKYNKKANQTNKLQQNKKYHQNQSINFSLSKQIHNNISSNNTLSNQQKLNNFNTQQSIIQDQQIKLNPGSYSFVSKSSFSKHHISQLLSPNKDQSNTSNLFNSKNKYNLYHNIHQKSSEIVDLSDSFSRKDFQLSKDQSSINLSDLKLSKLQKKRAQQRAKQKVPKPTSPTYAKTEKQQPFQQSFNKKPLQFMLVSQQKQLNILRNSNNQQKPIANFKRLSKNQQPIYQQKINLLTQFQKKVQMPKPLIPSNYNFQKKQSYQFQQFYKNSPQTQIYKKYSHEQSNQPSYQPSRLNDFIRNQVNQNLSPNIQENKERALSPNELFAQQMKRNSSYGSSYNQNLSSKNNGQSYVSQSASGSSLNNQPRIDFRQYEKPQISQMKRQNSRMSSNQEKEQSYVSSNRNSSRQRKKLRRHEDLQAGSVNEGILDQFIKKQYSNSQSSNSHSYNQNSYESYGSQSIKQDKQKVSQYNSKSVKEKEQISALDEFIK